jgi:DNA-binding response OmpR family regulator
MDDSTASAPRGDLLLLDNDSKIVELLSWFLGNQGFTVRVAASFAEARERLAERVPALLISDVDLGLESAVTELPKLSAEGILPPTLVVSGFLDESVRQALFSVPEVLDSLPKPFEFTDLEARVIACLSGQRRAGPDPAAKFASEPTSEPIAEAAPEPPPVKVEDEDDDDDWIEISPGG